MKANRMKNAARKQIQPNRKDVKSTAADNDRIYEKSLQSHPDEDGGFLFNYGWMDGYLVIHLCLSGALHGPHVSPITFSFAGSLSK